MFCYCYLHNAVQPLTAGLLLLLFSNIMPAFLQSYIDLFLLTLFLLKAHSLQDSLVNFKATELSVISILTARFFF